MTHFVNANPLNYDAKYPQTADAITNEEAKIANMEKNIGREVMFQVDDKQFYGKITGVPNSEHYAVVIGDNWDWYIREEAIHFVEKIY
jgi:hypothetical protein